MLCDEGGRTGVMHLQTKNCWQPQTLRTRDGIDFPRHLRREHDPADTCIWDFRLPDPQENTFLFFKATPCVALCDSSPRNLKQVHHLSQVLCLERSWSHARGSRELCPAGNEGASPGQNPRSICCGRSLDDL